MYRKSLKNSCGAQVANKSATWITKISKIWILFKGLFQMFFSDFQITYFPEHLWIALNTSESAKVNRICVKSIKQVLIRKLISMKWNFKRDIELKHLPLAVGSNTILGKIFLEVDQDKKEMI